MSINPGGLQVVARRMETIVNGHGRAAAAMRGELRDEHGHLIGLVGEITFRDPEEASGLGTIHCTDVPQFNPSHWPPRPTRMCLAVRLGITRILLESRP